MTGIKDVRCEDLKRKAEDGDAQVQHELGLRHYHGNAGAPRNYKEAETYFRMAANSGDARAQYWLARMYDERKVSDKNEGYCRQKAYAWYRQAAEKGNACAQLRLGEMSSNGEYGEKNKVHAYMYLASSAAQGNKEAREKLDELEKEMSAEEIAEAQRSVFVK